MVIVVFPTIRLNKLCVLQNDKSKIKKVIEELDEKKKETLKVTWEKVNKWVCFYFHNRMHTFFFI